MPTFFEIMDRQPDPMRACDWQAEVSNQYGRPLGEGYGDSREEAIVEAKKAADRELAHANPHWKWRKAKVVVRANPLKKV